ncbi:MAG: hypothetical protein COY81_03355 [Candidatus Pacebacteria bacterium CG_4_10_14_0_8_um_filter_43_12]|nr:MAG: hypothetical protein COU66_03155 [Candidatus Pacebacteria bacterium CG10_big_fil_rev_8_21_14_0_10_44_11]PIY79288.1 MAG: hypothetical protein COY81_03355 [Candidatus Pacebacteria bacterium CG_4_10_14_0_8_um_filter_43_12]
MKKYFTLHADAIFYGLIVLAGFLIFHFNLFRVGFPMSHDAVHHLIRTAHYFRLLQEGQFLPFWDGYMNQGFGSPLFNYVPPLLYILASLFKFVNFSTFLSLKITIIIFNIVFFWGSLKWLRLYFKTRTAFLATIILFFSPYRIAQIFVRGAFPEFAALSLTPLFLYFLIQSLKAKKLSKHFFLAAIMLSLILLAHTLFAIQLCLVLGLLTAVFFFQKRLTFIAIILGVLLLSLSLAAFMYLPILFEVSYVKLFLADAFNPQEHFSAFWQLFDPGWGLGFSMPGTTQDGMSFQLGVFHWLFGALTLFLLLYQKVKNVKFSRYSQLLLFVFILLLLTIFLQLQSPVTTLLYQKITIFHRQQFPWRLLNLSILCSTFIGAFAIDYFKPSWIKMSVLFCLIFGFSLYYLRPGVFLHFTDQELLAFDSDTTFSHEYTPIGRDTTAEKEYQAAEKVYLAEGSAIVGKTTSNSSKTIFEVISQGNFAKIRLNQLYFPGIRVFSNGEPLSYKVLTKEDLLPTEKRDVTGIIEIDLPAVDQTQQIEVIYFPTFWRSFGAGISLATYLLIGAYFFFTWTKRLRTNKKEYSTL